VSGRAKRVIKQQQKGAGFRAEWRAALAAAAAERRNQRARPWVRRTGDVAQVMNQAGYAGVRRSPAEGEGAR